MKFGLEIVIRSDPRKIIDHEMSTRVHEREHTDQAWQINQANIESGPV
jgi:hypothetical protein